MEDKQMEQIKKFTTNLNIDTFDKIRQLGVEYKLDNKNRIIEKAIDNEILRLKKEGRM